MAKRKANPAIIEVELSPKDIAKALDGIIAWIRSVRTTVLKLSPESTAKFPVKVPQAMAAPPQVDGCPPPDPSEDSEPSRPPKRPRAPRRPRRPRRPRGPR